MKYLFLLLFVLFLSVACMAIAPITGVTHACSGGSTTLSDATAGGVWSSSNPILATVDVFGVVYGVSAGVVDITYTVGSGYVSVPVTIYPLPAVFLVAGGGAYCSGDSGVHVTLVGSQTGVNYLLHYGASVTGPFAGTGSPLDFGLQTVAGVYTVIGTNTATTCSNTMAGSATVIINPAVIPSVSISTLLGDTLCSGSLVTFDAAVVSGGSSPTYQWNVNGINVGGDSAHYRYIPVNGDRLKITLISNAACASPDTIEVVDTVAVLATAAPTLSVSANPGARVCQGAAVLLTATPGYGGPAPTYRWIRNGSFVASGPDYTIIPIDGDIVYCVMGSNYKCRLADTVACPAITLIVDTPVTPFVSIVAMPGTTISHGQLATLTAYVTNAGASPTFQWFINSDAIPGATTSVYISDAFSAPYPDSITCIVTGSGACRISAYTWVYIVVTNVGVGAVVKQPEPLIWPNPAANELTLEHATGSACTIYDMMGREFLKVVIPANKATIDISALPKGIYIIELMDPATGLRVMRKVSKE